MRIQAYTQIQQAYQPKRANKTDKASAVSFSDRLQISSLGKDIQTAKQAVQNSADIREELVAPLKQSVQNGTYDVSDEDFASKLAEKYYGLF
ncbi:MAG: flagellar biosynthesis anti-sigma factor FlgM [Lachnospiraceae bacterium]|nr:flagellar biosynthesis anti-sigma factor FlgM [Lachnospiraceae bacterium]MBR2403228.1 flagellar biosynthesis anti-sigma factor FlgM [Lachnospiraceae bacterium]